MLSTEASALVILQPRATMVLYENEIVQMLKENEELWRKALQRGKYQNRNAKMMQQRATPATRTQQRRDV